MQVDYLTEDKPIPNQKYVIMSILSPGFTKKAEYANLRGIKIRGVYDTYEDAQKRADHLQKSDPIHNVFIGEVGKWLPFEDDPEKAKDATYSESKLNNLMKAYLKNQEEAKEMYERRKNEMMMQSISNESKTGKKKSRKSKIDSISEGSSNLESSDLNIDLSSLKEKEDEQLEDENVDEHSENEKVVKLEEELEKARLLLSKMDEVDNIVEVSTEKVKIPSKEDLETVKEFRGICEEMDTAYAKNFNN